jgi:hypothetical protein
MDRHERRTAAESTLRTNSRRAYQPVKEPPPGNVTVTGAVVGRGEGPLPDGDVEKEISWVA